MALTVKCKTKNCMSSLFSSSLLWKKKCFLFLCWRSVHTNHHCMITLIRFKSQLFNWFHLFSLHLFDFASKNCLGRGSRINTVCLRRDLIRYNETKITWNSYLDGNNEMSTVLQEILGIKSYNTSLIGLSNISENGVYHSDLLKRSK